MTPYRESLGLSGFRRGCRRAGLLAIVVVGVRLAGGVNAVGLVLIGAVIAGLAAGAARIRRTWVRVEDDALLVTGQRLPLDEVRSFTVRTGHDLRRARRAMLPERGMRCPPWMRAGLWVLTVPAGGEPGQPQRWLIGTSRPDELEQAFRRAVEHVQPGFQSTPGSERLENLDLGYPPPD